MVDGRQVEKWILYKVYVRKNVVFLILVICVNEKKLGVLCFRWHGDLNLHSLEAFCSYVQSASSYKIFLSTSIVHIILMTHVRMIVIIFSSYKSTELSGFAWK
ncbi:hypothetical protein Droror1_Dr00015506 [Drosera rotundifolia]